MKPECTTCRWHQVYRCPRVPSDCRFNCAEFAKQGKDCKKYQEREDG